MMVYLGYAERKYIMKIDEVQQYLADEIDHLTFLRERLTESGVPLAADEKQTIRRVLAGAWLSRIQREARLFFTEGSERDFTQSFETSLNTLQQLM